MTESDAHAMLLLQAFESPPLPPWTAADTVALDQRVLALVDERAVPAQLLARRAALGLDWLTERAPALRWLRDGQARTAQHGAALALLLLATAAGLYGGLSSGLDGSVSRGGERLNLLAPPLLALLGWNLAVYAVGLVQAWRKALRARPGRPASDGRATHPVSDEGTGRPVSHAVAPAGALRAWLQDQLAGWQRRAMRRLAARIVPSPLPPQAGATGHAMASAGRTPAAERAGVETALLRFAQAWARTSAPLQRERLVLLLHLAAALLAGGALAALYARGLAFDIRAGWASTFLGPAEVRHLLALVYGPAAALLGQSLPDAGALAGLRIDPQSLSGGESAARWIHLIGATVALLVLLPRLLLASRAALRLRRLRADFPLPADDPALRRLQHAAAQALGQGVLPVDVLPYSYRLSPARQARLASVVEQHLGPGRAARIAASLPLGAEDELARWLPQPPADTVVALFAMTATPEQDSHGALLGALAAALPSRDALQVMVDESGLRARLAAGDAEARLAQRRAAWQRLLQGLRPPLPPLHFVDLGGDTDPPRPGNGSTQAGDRPPQSQEAR